MWVPGDLPPNLVFLITITRTEPSESGRDELNLDARDAIATDATDEAAHLEDADGG